MQIPNWIKNIERYTTETWFVIIKLTPTVGGLGKWKLVKNWKTWKTEVLFPTLGCQINGVPNKQGRNKNIDNINLQGNP